MHTTKKILILIGHPSTNSFSHKLAKQYQDAAVAAGHTADVLNIYTMKPTLPLVNYQDYPDWAADKATREHYQQKISGAHKIVIFHPIWWGSMPPLLKNFIDQTLTPGFAYKYVPRKFVPQALNILPKGYLKGKSTHVFITFDDK